MDTYLKKHLMTLVKILVSFGLISYIISKFPIADAIKNMGLISWDLAIIGMFVSGLVILFQSLRWKLLLGEVGASHPLSLYLKYIMFGYLLQVIAPIGAGTEILKSYGLGKIISAKGQSIASILVGKIFGLTLVFVFFWIAILFSGELLVPDWTLYPVVGLSMGLLSIFLIIWVNPKLLSKIPKVNKHLQPIIDNIFDKTTLFNSLGLSFCIQGLICVIQYLFYIAVGAEIAFAHNVIYFSVFAILMYLPISVGGIGIREASSIYILAQLTGVTEEHCIQTALISYILLLIHAAIGAIIMAVSKKSIPQTRG